MKKGKLIVLGIVVVFALIGALFAFVTLRDARVEPFNLNEEKYYLRAIQDFPPEKILGSERFLGEVLTAEDAKNKALDVWLEVYGEDVKDEKPFKVFYDEQNEIWLVIGSLPPNYVGGVAHIIMRKSDGKVLTVWHDK